MSDTPGSGTSPMHATTETNASVTPECGSRLSERDPKPLKVLQILYTGLGGHGSVVFSLIQADRDRRWTSALAFIGIEPILTGYIELCRQAQIKDYDVIQFAPGKPFRAWWRLYRCLRQQKPDVILLHSLSAFLPAYLWRLIGGARLVAIEHTPDEMKSARDLVFSALSLRFADQVVCLSSITRANLLARLGRFGSPQRIVVIPNGVDTNVFYPREEPQGRDVVHLGMAGRFTTQKRQDLLIDMLEILGKRRPSLLIKLSFAGEGDTLDEVRQATHRAGVADQVEFLGTLDETTLADWYRELDIYLHATRAENMPTSVLQAMATALPIVSTDIPPMRAVLDARGQNGLFVERNDGQAFADAVLELIDDPVQRKALGQSARQTAITVFGNEAMFQSYDAVCRKNGVRKGGR